MSKILDSAVELNKIQYIAGNNTLNFTATPITGGAPIVDATAGVYANGAFAQANAAFNSANNVAPQIQPAFSAANSAGLYANAAFTQANAAFNSANNVAPQIQPAFSTANSAALYANGAFAQANTALSNTNLNVSGTIRMLNQGGDEGGEIFLDKPQTNTSLSAGITVDIYQNKLRIFETGGGIRGAFIDIANTTANGVGSEITKYDANTTSTGVLSIPIGTTAQRPASAANGQIRYNTTLGRIEAYLYSAGWTSVLSDQYTVEYLIVAGGGAGAGGQAGEGSAAGGGAGGLLQGSFTVNPQTIYTVTVGAGGSSGPAGDAGNNGSNSSALSQTAIGGGRGSQGNATSAQNAGSGGSGGGGGYLGTTSGSGTPGQGYPGGNPSGATGSSGGGGAGAAGTPATNSTAGPGGIGVNWQSLGTYYAGGGGGGRHINNSNVGSGGLGGGGDGGQNTNSGTAPAGGTNTGGGGGGENPVSSSTGGAGGSGIVIIRYQGSQRGTGGTVTSAGGYTYHTFTGSGSFTA